MTHVTIAGVTIFLHRAQAHRALDLHPVVAHFFRFWLWLTTGMVTREWVAIHRKHHAACETADDPHSPQARGIRTVLWRGAELYRDASMDAELVARYGRGTPDDAVERHVYTGRRDLGLGLMLGIDLLLFGVAGLSVWAVQMLWIPFWAAGVINGLGHWWGYRNQETDDASTNLVPWAIVIGGEELHNNHHAAPASARLSARWFEFDVGWLYIRCLQAVGLAVVRHDAFTRPSADAFQRLVRSLDRRFVRTVVLPVVRAERRTATRSGRRLLGRARWLLRRQATRLDSWQSQQLEQLLDQSDALATVYEMQQRLAVIWEQAARDMEAARRDVRDWCLRAEQSGIAALRDFAESLQGQLPKTA